MSKIPWAADAFPFTRFNKSGISVSVLMSNDIFHFDVDVIIYLCHRLSTGLRTIDQDDHIYIYIYQMLTDDWKYTNT